MQQKGTHCKKLPKLLSASITGSNRGTKRNIEDPKLVGTSNEAHIRINNIETTALIDSGSCISSISKSFYDEYLNNEPLRPLTEILKAECADGSELP